MKNIVIKQKLIDKKNNKLAQTSGSKRDQSRVKEK